MGQQPSGKLLSVCLYLMAMLVEQHADAMHECTTSMREITAEVMFYLNSKIECVRFAAVECITKIPMENGGKKKSKNEMAPWSAFKEILGKYHRDIVEDQRAIHRVLESLNFEQSTLPMIQWLVEQKQIHHPMVSTFVPIMKLHCQQIG